MPSSNRSCPASWAVSFQCFPLFVIFFLFIKDASILLCARLQCRTVYPLLPNFSLRSSCVRNLRIAKPDDHPHIVLLRYLQHSPDPGHQLKHTERKCHHHGSQSSGGTKQFKISPCNDDVLNGFSVSKRRMGDQDVRGAAEKHIWPDCTLPPLHIFIRLFSEALWIDPLLCQAFHFLISQFPE